MKQSAGERTKEKILKAGVKRWPDVNLSVVARDIGLTRQAVFTHFPKDTLKDAVAVYAVEKNNSKVIVQLIGSGHKAIKNLSKTSRAKHFSAI